MRNLKRFLALALTMLMVIGSFSLSAKSFADTAEMTTEQINALDLLSDLSIFIGNEDGTFGGADFIDRKEMAILASRIQTGEKFGNSYGENVTPFADVVSDFEAILYAHNMGIVIGYEDGTFRPTEDVILQDVITMIVRTLGYNGAAMDAGYPSTYINKARELGLTKGIASTVIPSWTSNVARQDVALLLYNALFAVKADGTTAAEFFGVDTYVVTAVGEYNITGVTAYLANDTRVVVQPLNADGSINDMYYHIPVAAFEEAGLTPVHGASYRIASTDNLETVKSISACPYVELANDADETVELYANGTVVITGVDGKPVTYSAVNRYTTVYNNQGTQRADNEIIVYNQRGFNWTMGLNMQFWGDKLDPDENNSGKPATDGLLTDAVGNLLDANGFIVAYYMPELNDVETVYAPYYTYDDATGTYAPATREDIAKAAQAQNNTTTYRTWTGDQAFMDNKGVVNANNSPFSITDKDDQYTAVAYDDNYDGKYDRLFFMYHTFGIGNGANGINVNSGFAPATNSSAAMSPYIADSTVAEGELVRFYVDAARKQYDGAWQGINHLTTHKATVVEKYETTTVSGLVTAVNGTKMTIGGQVYDVATLALHNFKEARPYTKYTVDEKALNPYEYIGQNVTAVLYDGGIFKVQGYENTWVIFEDYTGLTTNGYVTALAFSGSSELKNITIASVDGYFFLRNNYNIHTNTDAQNVNIQSAIFGRLTTGSFYEATKDVYGYYHINTVPSVTDKEAGNGWVKYVHGGNWNAPLRFANNRSRTVSLFTGNKHHVDGNLDTSDGTTYYMNNNANFIFTPAGTINEWIFFNPADKTFQAGKGFPTDGSRIEGSNGDGFTFFASTKPMNGPVYVAGNVAYFSSAKFYGSFGTGASSSNDGAVKNDVVWVSASDLPYAVDNTVPGMGGAGETLYGYRYIYSTGIYSLSSGKEVTVSTDGIMNYRLERGLYAVTNGVIDRKITRMDDTNGLIASAVIRGGSYGDTGLGNRYNGFALKSEARLSDGSQDDADWRIFDNVSYKICAFNGDGSFSSVFTENNPAKTWNSVEDLLGDASYVQVFYVKGSEYSETPFFFSLQYINHAADTTGSWTGAGGEKASDLWY